MFKILAEPLVLVVIGLSCGFCAVYVIPLPDWISSLSSRKRGGKQCGLSYEDNRAASAPLIISVAQSPSTINEYHDFYGARRSLTPDQHQLAPPCGEPDMLQAGDCRPVEMAKGNRCERCGHCLIAPDFSEYVVSLGLVRNYWRCPKCGCAFGTSASFGPCPPARSSTRA